VLAPFNFHWYDGVLPALVAVAVNNTFVPEQTEVTDALTETVGAEVGFTVTAIGEDVAVVGDAQPELDVITTVTASLFANAEDEYVLEFVPAFMPFTFHWYDGVVPPLVGVAVNVIEVPAQMLVAVALTDTAGVTDVATLIVIELEVTVEIELHVALEVTSQVITSLLARVVVVYVLKPVPTLFPFFFHWNVGDTPALVALAVNATLVPVHIEVAEALIVILGVEFGFTVIKMELDETCAGDAQLAFEVISTLTTSLLAKVLSV
jgi:hypothetical protein